LAGLQDVYAPAHDSPGAYRYAFQASGKPTPTYHLLGAPSWLHISAKGLVSGLVPKGTTSFSCSVVATNGVGIQSFTDTDIAAGPFRVTVQR
jgi:hypothetical protein